MSIQQTPTEDRALALLGAGVASEAVASALGVTASRISQLLAVPAFAEQVTQLRYENLKKHNDRDDKYDSLEDKLLAKLKTSINLMFKPETILKALHVVNNAKRRGQAASTEQASNQQNIVQLLLPSVITAKFTTNINNQVVSVGSQELLTMQSGMLLKQVETAEEVMEKEADE